MIRTSIAKGSLTRQALTLLIGVIVFVLVVYTLEKTGVPRRYSIAATALFATIVVMTALFRGGTTRAEPFLAGDVTMANQTGSLAITALAGLPLITLLGGATYFMAPGFLVTLLAAVVCGLAMAAVLSSRHFSASGATDLAEALVARHADSTLSARLLSAMALVPGITLAACAILAGSLLGGWLFALSNAVALTAFCILVVLVAVIGGMRSLLRFSAVAAGLFLLALNLPLLIHTLNANGFPIGHLSAGFNAVAPTAELETQLRSLGIDTLSDRMAAPSNVLDWGPGTQILAGLAILFATATLPAVVQAAAAPESPARAGHIVQRSILWAGLCGASMFALLAFTHFNFYQSNLGLTLAEASVEAPYLYSWGGRDAELVRLCGEVIGSVDALAAACTGQSDHILNVPDFTFDARLLLAASGEIANLPFAYTALLTLSLIGMLAAFSAGTILTTSGLFITGFYSTLEGKVASGRVFMIRICVVAVTGASMFVATAYIEDIGTAFMFGISLSATLFATAIAGLFHLPGSGRASMATALGTGFAICLLYYVLSGFGIDFVARTGDELPLVLPGMAQSIPPELGVIVALPCSLLVLLTAHFFGRHLKTLVATDEETETA